MFSSIFYDPLTFIFNIVALLVAITIHEFSHALVADRLGDPTAKIQGRITLNPLAHLDPVGTIALVFFHFGWGKPVPFDPFNLRNPRRDGALISLAGPASNMLLAFACSLLLQFLFFVFTGPLVIFIGRFLSTIIYLNVILAIFNLIPIHPLDGFKIVGGLLPDKKAREWDELSHYGLFFLLVLLFLPVGGGSIIHNFLNPTVSTIVDALLPDYVQKILRFY